MNEFSPLVVQCYNKGTDGYDVQVNLLFFRNRFVIRDLMYNK